MILLQSHRGIALLEVLLALTLFSLVALGLVRAFTQSMETASLSEHVAEATLGLQNQVDLTLARRLTPGEADLPSDGSGLIYHLLVQPTPATTQERTPLANVLQVDLSVRWMENRQEYNRDVSYLKYQP